MEKIELHEIRKKFLDFFASKEHLVHPSYSLIPKDDKSLLLIGAGMAPLKKYFTNEATPPSKRMTTSQKCVRTGDIDNVGKTLRHLTFFEMLGNFSFGDYFKEEAITWAWEFLTEVMKLPKERLWVSVYLEDDDAYNIWRDKIGIPEDRIVILGKEDNFWELEVGPSGPCSEIHYDKGIEFGCGKDDCKPGCDCDRFLEVWNLVFTQFDKDQDGVYHPLAHPNIDTGMGLERIACVMENVESVYDIKAIRAIVDVVSQISNRPYEKNHDDDVHLRIIADHARAMTFLISDGVVPSNEGRGYVLRKLIRRASRHGMLLGIEDMFLEKPVGEVIRSWGKAYPELIENKKIILEVLNTEEERFKRTIVQGNDLLSKKIEEIKKAGKNLMDGEDVFVLYDTYGFPAELTEEILRENDLDFDEVGFKKAMEEQRNRAREAIDKSDSGWRKDSNLDISSPASQFLGYELEESNSKILDIYFEGEKVESVKQGDKALVVLDETPFYGESGGQVGDKGFLTGEGFRIEIVDTKKTKEGVFLHEANVISGQVHVGDMVKAEIDSARRVDIKRNHSATHLLHAALRSVLGTHVNQAGSRVEPDRLRFDFSHYQAMTEDEIKRVEKIVNDKILESIPVLTEVKPLDEARKEGVTGLFEDKYGDVVRVLKMGTFSQELCGGTHVKNTSEIGLFKIVSETGVAAGVRRIEAITGHAAYSYVLGLEELVTNIASVVKSKKDNILKRIEEIDRENREDKKTIENLKAEIVGNKAGDLEKLIEQKDKFKLIKNVFENISPDEMKNMADELRNKYNDIVIIFASKREGALNLLVATTKDNTSQGINSGKIIKKLATKLGGNGGGRPDMAMAGAKDVDNVDKVLAEFDEILE